MPLNTSAANYGQTNADSDM